MLTKYKCLNCNAEWIVKERTKGEWGDAEDLYNLPIGRCPECKTKEIVETDEAMQGDIDDYPGGINYAD